MKALLVEVPIIFISGLAWIEAIMIIKEIAEQTSMIWKVSLIAFGLFFASMFFLCLFLYFPFIITALVIIGTFFIFSVPMYIAYKLVRWNANTSDGAIITGMLCWLIVYLVVCMWMTLALNHDFVRGFTPIIDRYRAINIFVDKVGFWICPIAIVATIPFYYLGFYSKRWMHR